MRQLIVVSNPADWPLAEPGVDVVAAHDYLLDPGIASERNVRVYNLSRSYRYQSTGYYVSLLAAARGHKPLPSITTIQDIKQQAMVRAAADELDALIQKSLKDLRSPEFTLSVYFGRNLAQRHQALSQSLFSLFPAPLLRARFTLDPRHEAWRLQQVDPIAAQEIPDEHRAFVVEAARDYFVAKRRGARRRRAARYDLAILRNAAEPFPPSNARAIVQFARAAEQVGFAVELIDKDAYGRLGSFDALFIRETTSVHHHTYRFARLAAAEGLVVIDDPESILKCTNKVFLAELLARHKVPTPMTTVVHRRTAQAAVVSLPLPCILKQPDSSFSQGVSKVESRDELRRELDRLLQRSDLVIAQEFVPTAYDWRVGVIDRTPLFVCRYFMAKDHWQIVHHDKETHTEVFGDDETLAVEDAPPEVLRVAMRAANLIGDGLYGVDLKMVDGRCVVIEVNDNPSIDVTGEDKVLGPALYRRIMEVMMRRVEARKAGGQR